jgi:hypothetical protein
MLIALLLVLFGIFLIVSSPILGFIPGVVLVFVGIVLGILALLGGGVGALLNLRTTKVCPDCRSRIPTAAAVCRHCGYRYA